MMDGADLGGAFDRPALAAADTFRAAMEALARPGTITGAAPAAPPAPLSPAAGALLLTLADADTPVHLAGAHDAEGVRAWLAFHTGAPLVGAAEAVFAAGPWPALQPLDAYPAGTPDYPDRGATLIVETDALHQAGARLTGPGIDGAAHLSLPDPAALAENARRYPLGLDLFFTAGARLAALPRSTTVTAPSRSNTEEPG